MKVLLADDEPLALERLVFAFRNIPDVEIVGQAENGTDALKQIAALSPDVVLLDIQMPGRSGLAVAAELPAEKRPEVIFVTAFEGHAPDAFDVEAVDYLIKPVRFDRLRQAIDRARRRRAEREAFRGQAAATVPSSGEPALDSIMVPDPRGNRHVPLSMINWIEAAKDYALLHTESRSHMIRATMADLERQLEGSGMLRVHRSAFVRKGAVRQVRRLGRGAISLLLDGGIEVTVGPSYLRTTERALSDRAR